MLVCIFACGEAVLLLSRGARECIFSKFLIIDPLHIIEHGSPQKDCPTHDGFSILRDVVRDVCGDFVSGRLRTLAREIEGTYGRATLRTLSTDPEEKFALID